MAPPTKELITPFERSLSLQALNESSHVDFNALVASQASFRFSVKCLKAVSIRENAYVPIITSCFVHL